MTSKCSTCPSIGNVIEEHHVVPLSYGGKRDGLKVSICGNCHTTVHKHIENFELTPPTALRKIVEVGRLAKQRFLAGELEARDRRPTLLIPMSADDAKILAYLQYAFNTKSKASTVLAALHYAAQNVRRVT